MADLGALLGATGIGGTIGKAIVSLELSTAKYQAELQAAEAKTVSSTNNLSGGFSKFSGLAQAAFLGIGAAAVTGLALSVGAAVEAEKAHAQLANTVRNAAQLSEASVQAFEDQAEAIRHLTGVDDEAIISGDALLGQMGLTQDQITQLAPLVVDLSEKFDIDLQSAFKAVGKAATGNTGTLARYVGAIEKGKTPAETFANVLEKLGRSEGFAAEQAKNEPWKILQSDLQELSEDIGTALLPAIRGLADTLEGLIPLIEKVAQAIQLLPVVQMGQDFQSTGNGVTKFADTVIDTIPILGHFVNLSGTVSNSLNAQRGVVGELSDFYRTKYTAAIGAAGQQTSKFAHMTQKELADWSEKTKESFDSFVLTLDETATATVITRKEFVKATNVMQREADNLNTALKRISKEKWVNDEYIAFLSEQGPEWLIGFANLTETEQRKAQKAWEESTRKTDAAKQSLDKITGVLKNLDSGTTKHTVEIQYVYKGYDPSKPGMSSSSGSNQQR